MTQFFTEEFFAEMADRLNEDEEWLKKSGNLTTKVIATCTDRDLSILIDIADGKVATSKVAADDPADFKFEGDYAAWTKAGKGEADLQALALTGKIRFKGSMSKIMAMMGQLNRLVAVLREIPKEF